MIGCQTCCRCYELYGNEIDPPLRNGDINLLSTKEACGQSKEPRPNNLPKTYKKVKSKEVSECQKTDKSSKQWSR